MKRKAFTLIEIIGAIAIIGISFVVIIRFMGNRSSYIDKTHTDLEGYSTMGTSLSEVEMADDEIDGNVTVSDGTDTTGIHAIKKTATINGQAIEYELLYKDEETSSKNIINDFTYNFKDILLAEAVPSTKLSIFPIEPDFAIDTEPLDSFALNPKYNPANPKSEKYVPVYGLLSRTNSNYIPMLEYDHLDYLKENENFVTIQEDKQYIDNSFGVVTSDRNRVKQKLIDDGIAMLKAQIDTDPSKAEKYQVLFLERQVSRLPVLFYTTKVTEFDLTPLSKDGKDVNFVLITNSQFGHNYTYASKETASYIQFKVKGGNIYLLSMYDVPGISANFEVNGEDESNPPQFTYAMGRGYEGQEFNIGEHELTIGIAGNASFFIYTPLCTIDLTGKGNKGTDGVFQGGIVTKNARFRSSTSTTGYSEIGPKVTGNLNSTTGEYEFKREEWEGTAELLGFKNYLGEYSDTSTP
ncbi:MAG: hypothetical protein ACK5LV_05235 [Lachnospirales bacterium]